MNHDLSSAAEYYDRLAAGATNDRDAVGWHKSYVQDVIFLSLARVEGLRSGSRVLDVGCGLGALYEFFQRTGLAVDYTGIDISEKMIAGARARHPQARFELRDILRNPPRDRYDFVICSGALSLRMPNQDAYLQDMIASMFGLADTALAFNLLSAYAFMSSPILQATASHASYVWPDQVMRFCKTQTPFVSIAHDVDGGLFFVYLYRHQRAALARLVDYVKPGRTYSHAVQSVIDYHLALELHAELREFLANLEPSAPVLFYQGMAHAALGDTVDAETAFRKSMAADASAPWPHIQLAYMCSRNGEAERALTEAREAVRIAPAEIEAHRALATIAFAHRRMPEARAATAAMPDGPLAFTMRAATNEDPKAALAELDRALAAAPSYLPALIQRAELIEQSGDRSGALAAWRAAAKVAPVDRSIARRIEALER